jgi:hypothetical protein
MCFFEPLEDSLKISIWSFLGAAIVRHGAIGQAPHWRTDDTVHLVVPLESSTFGDEEIHGKRQSPLPDCSN